MADLNGDFEQALRPDGVRSGQGVRHPERASSEPQQIVTSNTRDDSIPGENRGSLPLCDVT